MMRNLVPKKNPLFTPLKRGRKALEPRRNYNCPQYEECLDEAANLDRDLVCRCCPREPMESNLD